MSEAIPDTHRQIRWLVYTYSSGSNLRFYPPRRFRMAIQAHLVELERKHKILENELHEALVHLSTDDLQILELKRRKLMVKDEIERLRHTASETLHQSQSPQSRCMHPLSPDERFRAHPQQRCGYALANSPTWSAIASDDVSPGDSMPNRLISPATPWSRGPWIRKSCVATAGGTIFGRIPE